MTTTLARFDDIDRLNDDGTITARIAPSAWRAYNISPDTYQSFTGDQWTENLIHYHSEETGLDLVYDDFEWTYNHAGVVRGLSDELCDWMVEELHDLGLVSVSDGRVIESWSPQFYNFTSDGFEMELTFDPSELRALTPNFDVDAWVHEHYRSVDGFMSYVPSRMDDDDWRAEYDAAFRLEYLLDQADQYRNRDWIYRLAEVEWEVYEANTQVELIGPEHRESGHTLRALEEWARDIANDMSADTPSLLA